MKKVAAVAVLLALCLFLIPMGIRHDQQKQDPSPTPQGGGVLTILHNDTTMELDLEEYLWGVVAAEMPASFHIEALKAQAVAARTYSVNKAGGSANHPEADLCTYPGCCQAWISLEEARAGWGADADFYTDKISQAVTGTAGQVLTYEGELISALYHASTGDATQDAVAVWGYDVPYLVSVSSPESNEDHTTTVTFTPQEYTDALKEDHPEAVLEGNPADWVAQPTYNAAGYVEEMVTGLVTLTGQEARSIFGLRSARFTVTPTAEAITFEVVGHGHGVGMSQYGAHGLAAEGAAYEDILTHYYTGVELTPMTELSDQS